MAGYKLRYTLTVLLVFVGSLVVFGQSVNNQNCFLSILDFGAKMDGQSDDTKAIMSSLDSLNYAYIPMNEHGAKVTSTIHLKPFQVIFGMGRGSVINSYVPAGHFTILVADVSFVQDARIENLTLQIRQDDANGIGILRSRNVFVDNIFVSGNNKCNIGFQIDGGTEKGSAWNQLDRFTIGRCKIGINLTSDTPLNFCNRNFIGYGIVQSCETGINLYRANTNTINANTQGCPTGIHLNSSKSNRIVTVIENSTKNSVVVLNNSNNNVISGAMNIKRILNQSKNNSFNLSTGKQKEFNDDNEE